MIGWLQGQLAERWQHTNRCGLLLVCNGVGYEVQVPRRQWERLGESGSALTLHIHQVIRDDGWTLYGFASRAERDLFRELVAVSGVGPQMALGLLGQLSCEELVRAIVQADLRLLSQAPGVGKRTAERLAESDERQAALLQRFGDRFLEELAAALERGDTLERSQLLLCGLLQQLKLNYLAQMNRAGIGALMEELDQLTVPSGLTPPEPPATPPA